MLALSGQTPDIDIWMNKNLLSWESLWGIQEVWPAQQRCYHISSSLRETEKVIIENINLVCPDSRHISFTWWDCISRNWRLERVKLYRLELAEEEKKEVTDNLFRNIWTLETQPVLTRWINEGCHKTTVTVKRQYLRDFLFVTRNPFSINISVEGKFYIFTYFWYEHWNE